MALISCPECGNQVSDKAKACPHCGYPLLSDEPEKKEYNYVDNESVENAAAEQEDTVVATEMDDIIDDSVEMNSVKVSLLNRAKTVLFFRSPFGFISILIAVISFIISIVLHPSFFFFPGCIAVIFAVGSIRRKWETKTCAILGLIVCAIGFVVFLSQLEQGF